MIVDAHTDVVLEVVVDDDGSLELRLRERLFERYWLARLEAGEVGVQICPLYGLGAPAQAAELGRAVEENADRVCLARTRADLDDARLRLVLSMEGVEPLEGDADAFEPWYDRGVRSVGLTWNHPNEFAGGIETPDQGLSARGRTLVRRFAELGLMLDLAHASEQTWRDVIDEGVPFSVTHANCRAIHDQPRNLADWQLEAVAERGGVVGMMALGFVVDPEAPTVDRWLDHFDHAVAVMGIEHVGLGADFVDHASQVERKAPLGLHGFTGPDDFPALAAALRTRGYDGDRLAAILSENWLRVLRTALPA